MSTAVGLFVSVPVVSYRAPRAREYLQTLPVPPPATIYGMLLSAVGEPDRLRHRGAEIAVGVLGAGQLSKILRTAWRVKSAKDPLGLKENKRPDFQELLTAVRLATMVRAGTDGGSPPLVERIAAALDKPDRVTRFGGLSLGESTMLVDEFRLLRDGDLLAVDEPAWLAQSPSGALALPVWADHVGSQATRYAQFSLVGMDSTAPPEAAWVRVEPPASD